MRNWRDSDRLPFAEMCADAAVMEYFPSVLSPKQSDALIDRLQAHFDVHGYTFFAVDELASGEFVGFVGIIEQDMTGVDWTPATEIGWRLRAQSWGKGYATEAAKSCLDFAFTQLSKQRVVAITPTVNAPSIRVMKRLAMQHVGNFDYPGFAPDSPLTEHVLYEAKPD